jgi:hypothetical protein
MASIRGVPKFKIVMKRLGTNNLPSGKEVL